MKNRQLTAFFKKKWACPNKREEYEGLTTPQAWRKVLRTQGDYQWLAWAVGLKPECRCNNVGEGECPVFAFEDSLETAKKLVPSRKLKAALPKGIQAALQRKPSERKAV